MNINYSFKNAEVNNGAGKSNLIAFFKLVNELMGGRLQQHIGATGASHGQFAFRPEDNPSIGSGDGVRGREWNRHL